MMTGRLHYTDYTRDAIELVVYRGNGTIGL